MNRLRDLLARRASTDAGLGEERADSDRIRSTLRRTLDDIIELDRFAADRRLRASREASDRSLPRDRADAPSPNSSAIAEREDADALVQRERQHADAAVAAGRRQEENLSAGVEARRHDTDARLATERAGEEVAQAMAFDLAGAALARAEADGNRRDDVTGMVAHDLRGALTVVVICARMIVDETKEESTRQAAEEITQAAGRMERLLTDMLDVTRIDAGTFRIVKRPHNVGELLHEVQRAYGPLFLDRKMSLLVEGRPSPLVASFDHDRIVQVFSNLLGNALKFTPAKGTVDVHVVERADEVEFTVRDNGPGISSDALPHLFERFWQLDTEAPRGLGLGLYICEKTVQAHGGRIWAESELGKGAAFHFTLPVAA